MTPVSESPKRPRRPSPPSDHPPPLPPALPDLRAVATPAEGGAPSRPTVLVVDDEQAVASVLARGLTYAGYEVCLASNGVEALEKLAERRFDVLLTDVQMPRLRGDEMQRIARERDPELAVLLITATDDVGMAVDCLKGGAFDYLTKPFDLADVLVRVGKALERQRLVRENADYRRNLERRVEEQAERLRLMMRGSLEALIQALEAKDAGTHNHSTRVSGLAVMLARAMYPDDGAFAERVRVAALFHDIGKIGIPESVLHKPGPLTEDEMEMVRRHPETGETILRPLLDPETVAMVRGHHEQWNGRGYPDRLAGADIPPGGRIIAVADAYDAMTSARPYRREILRPYVLEILRRGAGSQWDPEGVNALLHIAASGGLPARLDAPPWTEKDQSGQDSYGDAAPGAPPPYSPLEAPALPAAPSRAIAPGAAPPA